MHLHIKCSKSMTTGNKSENQNIFCDLKISHIHKLHNILLICGSLLFHVGGDHTITHIRVKCFCSITVYIQLLIWKFSKLWPLGGKKLMREEWYLMNRMRNVIRRHKDFHFSLCLRPLRMQWETVCGVCNENGPTGSCILNAVPKQWNNLIGLEELRCMALLKEMCQSLRFQKLM